MEVQQYDVSGLSPQAVLGCFSLKGVYVVLLSGIYCGWPAPRAEEPIFSPLCIPASLCQDWLVGVNHSVLGWGLGFLSFSLFYPSVF